MFLRNSNYSKTKTKKAFKQTQQQHHTDNNEKLAAREPTIQLQIQCLALFLRIVVFFFFFFNSFPHFFFFIVPVYLSNAKQTKESQCKTNHFFEIITRDLCSCLNYKNKRKNLKHNRNKFINKKK